MIAFLKKVLQLMAAYIVSVIITLVLLISIMIVLFNQVMKDPEVSLPEKYDLIIELDQLDEVVNQSPLNKVLQRSTPLDLTSTLLAIEHATNDPAVNRVLINFKSSTINIAHFDALAQSLNRLSAQKTVLAFSENYSFGMYHAAKNASKVYLHPNGYVEIKGLSLQLMYFKDLLNNVGVDVEPIRVGKFKSAVEPFIADSMSAENRLQLNELVGGMWTYFATDIIQQRNISKLKLESIVNNLAYLIPSEAKNHGFVDSLVFWDDLMNQNIRANQAMVKLSSYYDAKAKEIISNDQLSQNQIALLLLDGGICSEGDDEGISAVNTLKEIHQIAQDSTIKIVVLRINSPGGSAQASETIYQALKRLAKDKTIIVSMGSVAASGGYYIAMVADKVFAQQSTITGSIGVYGMMVNISKLNEKIGVHFEKVNTHEMSDFPTLDRGLSDKEKARMQLGIDSIYYQFLSRVAKNRGKSIDEIHELAQGRVWNGEDALKHGLVDSLGGVIDVLAYVEKTYGVSKNNLKIFPQKKSLKETLQGDVDEEWLIKLPLPMQQVWKVAKKLDNLNQYNQVQMRLPYSIEIR